MSELKATPGPWATEYCSVGEVYHIAAGAYPYGSHICEVGNEPREGNPQANADLIAAAPALYDDAEFLCARVRELESDLADDDAARQFYGHVLPALARMESSLKQARGDLVDPLEQVKP